MANRATVDPAQLVALNALLEECSVTKAAKRLGITQSSMSHRLALLRRAFGDPLLVRCKSELVPTPRALAMTKPLADALRALEASVAPLESFEPATSRFTLSIAMPDLLAPLAPQIVESFLVEAPNACLRFTSIVPGLSGVLASDGLGMALTPTRFVEGDIHSRSLGELSFGVVGRKNHPALRRPLTPESWLAHGHVLVRIGNERTNVIEEELARRGLERRVGIEVPSFLAGLLVVARSDYLMNVPLPLAREAVASLGLRLRASPIPLPTIRFALAWHARYHQDPAHRWAREHVLSAVRPAFLMPD